MISCWPNGKYAEGKKNKMIKKILIIAVVLIIVIISLRNKIVEIAIERTFEFVTGVRLDIGSMEVNLTKTSVKIKDMKVYNPEQYADRLMADVPEIYLDYNLRKRMEGVVHINELKFHLKELHIIKNKEGKVNISYLKAVDNKTGGERLEKEEKGKFPDIEIGLLHLKAGKVVYKNYTKAEPVIREFNVNLDKKYENISDPYTLIRLIISSVLRNTAISHIVNVPMAGVQRIMDDASKAGALVIKDAVGSTTDAAGKIFTRPAEVLSEVTKGLSDILGGSVFKEKKVHEE